MTKKTKKSSKRRIDTYEHIEQDRPNNPPVGLVTSDTDKDQSKKTYAYDPHADPLLQWTGKTEHTSFEVPTVSLHVHERIDPKSIIEQVKKKNGDDRGSGQPDLFSWDEQKRSIREAIEFYKHKDGWTNRLIAGDSLLVMNSLLEKEGMAGRVQMIYIDPPYGIQYGSNFQPFSDSKNVRDGKEESLTNEPEVIRAYRDTWELGIHSYLTYMRDRLLLAHELLHESGSCFVQISDENMHHIRALMDEVFGPDNFVRTIIFKKTGSALQSKLLNRASDYIIWYAKDKEKIKFRNLYTEKTPEKNPESYKWVEEQNGTRRRATDADLKNDQTRKSNLRFFSSRSLVASGHTKSCDFAFDFEGKTYRPQTGKSWKTTKKGIERLIAKDRIFIRGINPYCIQYLDELSTISLENIWNDTGGAKQKKYVVQTSPEVIKRCLLMTTDPGDLVLDPTCGGGTTAFVAEEWGRRWITCDTSRIATTLTKQRLVTAYFDYFKLAQPQEGVGSGFKYRTVKYVTLRLLTNDEPSTEQHLFDHPIPENKKIRVTGPFTVEAVPSPIVLPIDDIEVSPNVDASIARSGATDHQYQWEAQLQKTGIRGKNGQHIEFSRVETLPACRYLHAEAETKTDKPERAVISFGPDHAPLGNRQVNLALEEANKLIPNPTMIVFAAFQFDAEAAKNIDEIVWSGKTLLKVQMNSDLLTKDLRRNKVGDESFWLVGQPDVAIDKTDNDKWQVTLQGFDYFDTVENQIISGNSDAVAMWMLDTNYNGRSLIPQQIFFPVSDDNNGWGKLAKNLKAEIDLELIEAYHKTKSLPFNAGENQRVAVKIIDNRGIESLKVIDLQSSGQT